jgi:hypothetical protein
MTIDNNTNNDHVLAYGIEKTIRPMMTLQKTLEELERQNAVS